MQPIDTLIHCDRLLPIVPRHTVLEQHALAIDKGVIIDILPNQAAQKQYAPLHRFDLEHHVVMPGLINAHNHGAMSLLRGIADDLALMTWLNDHIWPAEGRFVDVSFVEDGTRLAVAEMLRSGTTCFNDMYFFPDVTASVANKIGMRAVVGLLMMDFPTPWGTGPEDYLKKGLAVYDKLKGMSLINATMAPHAPYTVSDAPLKKLITAANELDIPIQMHIHETAQEVDDSLKQHGMRPLARLEKLGLLSPRLQAVHMTQLDEDDISMVKHHGVNVVHCPESNMKLASGICPTRQLLAEGVNLALGTDGAASNNDLDMFGEMRSAALLAKVATGDAQAFTAEQALYAATMGGAIALGHENHIGSLEVGKQADLIALSMDSLNTAPLYNLHSHLVYACNSRQVEHVWVNGKHLVSGRQFTTLDEEKLVHTTRHWQEKISKAS